MEGKTFKKIMKKLLLYLLLLIIPSIALSQNDVYSLMKLNYKSTDGRLKDSFEVFYKLTITKKKVMLDKHDETKDCTIWIDSYKDSSGVKIYECNDSFYDPVKLTIRKDGIVYIILFINTFGRVEYIARKI